MKILLIKKKRRIKKLLMLSIKIAIGSSMAIYVAELLELQYTASAGTITLLTLMATKWETVRLSIYRILTFIFSTLLAIALFTEPQSEWIAYGLFIGLVTAFSEFFGWRSTISVNAVIGTHFLTHRDFSISAIWGEFQILLIGIFIALFLNMFHGNHGSRKAILEGMRNSEKRLQMLLRELAGYLNGESSAENVWDDIYNLKNSIQNFIQEAYEYQENTFQDMRYYYDYLGMRLEQCNILYNLHNEIKKVRTMPMQSAIVADYMIYLSEYVLEINVPDNQLKRLEDIFLSMKQESLPVSREEFENRAILYHVLLDLEDFLKCKEQFVYSLSKQDLEKYWN